MKQYLVLWMALTLAPSLLQAQSEGSFEDLRDGRTYKTVQYELTRAGDKTSSMTWMAQNLNYETQGSYCLNSVAANWETYGRFYTWSSAREACPVGWHLPSDDEWTELADLFGGAAKAGTALKGTDELWPEGKGTNESRFNGQPAGTRGSAGGYHNLGVEAIFWSADERDDAKAWDWKLLSNWSKIQPWEADKGIGNSVRCVRD